MHYLAPLFVTVDSEKDDPEKMANTVDLFNSKSNRTHMRLVGLTGPDCVKVHPPLFSFHFPLQTHPCMQLACGNPIPANLLPAPVLLWAYR